MCFSFSFKLLYSKHDNDVKILSRKALDILIPYLPSTV